MKEFDVILKYVVPAKAIPLGDGVLIIATSDAIYETTVAAENERQAIEKAKEQANRQIVLTAYWDLTASSAEEV